MRPIRSYLARDGNGILHLVLDPEDVGVPIRVIASSSAPPTLRSGQFPSAVSSASEQRRPPYSKVDTSNQFAKPPEARPVKATDTPLVATPPTDEDDKMVIEDEFGVVISTKTAAKELCDFCRKHPDWCGGICIGLSILGCTDEEVQSFYGKGDHKDRYRLALKCFKTSRCVYTLMRPNSAHKLICRNFPEFDLNGARIETDNERPIVAMPMHRLHTTDSEHQLLCCVISSLWMLTSGCKICILHKQDFDLYRKYIFNFMMALSWVDVMSFLSSQGVEVEHNVVSSPSQRRCKEESMG